MSDRRPTFFEKGAETALEKEQLGDYCLDYAIYALESAAGIEGEELNPEDRAIEEAAEKYVEKIRNSETNIELNENKLEDITLIKENKMIFFPEFKDLNYSAQLYCMALADRKENLKK